MSASPLLPEERELVALGLSHPALLAHGALLAAREEALTERLLTESDVAEIHRLQGAVRELRRFAAYPAELERRLAAFAEE